MRAGNHTVVSRPGKAPSHPLGFLSPANSVFGFGLLQATVLVIVPYETVEEDVVVCTASDGGTRTEDDTQTHRGPDS